MGPTFNLIAKANSGVAVFAAGLLWLHINSSSVPKLLITLSWSDSDATGAASRRYGMSFEQRNLQMMVLAGALPPAFSGIIIPAGLMSTPALVQRHWLWAYWFCRHGSFVDLCQSTGFIINLLLILHKCRSVFSPSAFSRHSKWQIMNAKGRLKAY